MSDDENQIEELAAEIGEAFNASTTMQSGLFAAARVARDHFAKPVMTEDARSQIIRATTSFACSCRDTRYVTSDICENWLVELGLIPPRPVPTPGERFAASCDFYIGKDSRPDALPDIARRFDDAVGPLVELAKSASDTHVTSSDLEIDWIKQVGTKARNALANFEAKIGGTK